MNERLSPNARRWAPAAVAGGVLAVVLIAGVALGGGRNGGSSSGDDRREPMSSTVAEPVVETLATSVPIVKTVLDRTLSKGLAGDDVAALQTRLTDLGFWPGPIDGYFGDETRRAVWAYEKLVLGVDYDKPSGAITPEIWDAMQDPFVIAPRRTETTPNHVEIYLDAQVLAVFHGDRPVMISHISSGDNQEWCEEVTISPGEWNNQTDEPLVRGECGRSFTPGGVFSIERMVAGVRQSSLGGMWDPVYFNYGIAVHGAINVPLHPASHGCIRIPLSLSPSFQELTAVRDQVFVFDGEFEPEHYGKQKPVFNWIDPDYSTTTSSTTSTSTTTTTTVPPTTVPTVTVPATTSTTPAATTSTTTSVEPGG